MKENLDKPEQMKRQHIVHFKLNSLEKEALDKYCKKYKIKNRSKFIRESVITTILQRFEEDYPSLFEALPEEQKEKLFSD